MYGQSYAVQSPVMGNTMMIQPPPHGTNSARLLFYTERSNGTLVPLIPADELPFNVRFHGVPRVLNQDQVFGLQCAGSTPYTGKFFALEENATQQLHRSNSNPNVNPAVRATHTRNFSGSDMKHFSPPDAHAREAFASKPSTFGPVRPIAHSPLVPRQLPDHELSIDWRRGNPTGDAQSAIDAIMRTQGGAEEAAKIGYIPKHMKPLPPSGYLPDEDKKEYCTHWIRHGECDYTQQGCRYKHEMPDKATLERIGFRKTPLWFVESMQSVKFKENNGIVGPIVKTSEWLRSRPRKPSSDDETDGSELDQARRPSVGKAGVKGKQKTIEYPRQKLIEGPKDNIMTTLVPKPSTPTPESATTRKPSSANLIDFESPLPSPASSVKATPSNGSGVVNTPTSSPSKATAKSTSAQPTKKSVPTGEDADTSAGETKKRHARRHAASPRNISDNETTAPSKQPYGSAKVRKNDGVMASIHANEESVKANGGMMASKHADPNFVPRAQREPEVEGYQVVDATPRPRRRAGHHRPKFSAPASLAGAQGGEIHGKL